MHQGHIGLLLRLDQAVGQLAVTDKGFAGLQVVGEEKGFPLPGGGLCVDFGRSHNGMPVQQPAQKRQMLRPRSAAAAQQGSSGGQQPLRLLRKMRRVQRNHSAVLPRKRCSGFRQQRHRRIGKGVLQPFGHPNGAKGTVEPHRRRAQGLQGNNGGEQARPGAGFALPVHRQRQQYRQTGLPAGQQRRTGLRKPGQCFADQQIRAALLQSGRLDSVGIHQPVKGNPVAVPVFGVDREPNPGQIPRDQHAAAGRFLFSGPAGQEKQPPIGVAQFVR